MFFKCLLFSHWINSRIILRCLKTIQVNHSEPMFKQHVLLHLFLGCKQTFGITHDMASEKWAVRRCSFLQTDGLQSHLLSTRTRLQPNYAANTMQDINHKLACKVASGLDQHLAVQGILAAAVEENRKQAQQQHSLTAYLQALLYYTTPVPTGGFDKGPASAVPDGFGPNEEIAFCPFHGPC